MTSDDALEDDDLLELAAARVELRKHFCAVLNTDAGTEGSSDMPERICVTNACDAPEWIRCSPKAILEWLGY